MFNLVTKRAVEPPTATVRMGRPGNLGSEADDEVPPSVHYLVGERSHGEKILSIAFAGKGQHQDAGGKIIHAAPGAIDLEHLRQV